MAKMNIFTAQGIKPSFDSYRVKMSFLEEQFQKIIKDKYGVHVTVNIEPDEEENDQVRVWVTNPINLDEDIADKMMDDGIDPDDEQNTQHTLSFIAAGGQDAWLVNSGIDQDNNRMVEFQLNSRQDIEVMTMELLETALNGTRDETVAAINALHKYIKG